MHALGEGILPQADFSVTHVWLGAATVAISPRQIRRVFLRQSVRVSRDTRIDIEELYCRQCRRTYNDVKDQPCEAAASNEHLRGGPIGVRAKRTHKHNCEMLGCVLPAQPAEGPPLAATG